MKQKILITLAVIFVLANPMTILAHSDCCDLQYALNYNKRVFTIEEVVAFNSQLLGVNAEIEKYNNQDSTMQPRVISCCSNMRIVVRTGWGCVIGNNGRCIGMQLQWRTESCANCGTVISDVTLNVRECPTHR